MWLHVLLLLATGPVVTGFTHIPPNVTVRITGHDAVLKWNPSTTQGVTGYAVYRSQTAGGPYQKLSGVNASPYTDLAVSTGTYFYVVRAQKGSQESANSNEAKAVIP